MPLEKVILLSFTALLTMVNPLAVVPAFVTLTDGTSRRRRASVALMAAVGTASYLGLLASVPLSLVMGDRGRTVFSKIMALLLGAIGVQFIINGLTPVLTEIMHP